MKNKLPILLLILSVALAAISSCNGATATGSSSELEVPVEAALPEDNEFDVSSINSIVIEGVCRADSVEYLESSFSTAYKCNMHKYRDSNGNEYTVSDNGTPYKARLYSNYLVEEDEDKNFTTEQITALANNFVSIVADEDDSLSLVSFYTRGNGLDKNFYFLYSRTHGGFITDNCIMVTFNVAGEVLGFSNKTFIDYSDITDADLAEYTDEYIYGYTEAMLNLDHPGDIAEIEIGNIWLLPSEDGGFELKIYVNYRLVDDYVEYADQLILPVA